jgi:16S rRNA processing protein RimM
MEVVVGRIGRAHGVRGEVSVEVRTDEPGRRFAPGVTLRAEDRPERTLTVHAVRPHGARLLVSFQEIPDRTGAESLRGATLLAQVAETDRPEQPDEFYDHQLVGLTVRTERRGVVGEVGAVLHLPEQDVLVVSTGEGTESLVPFVAALVPSVDLDAGELIVADQPGLLDGGDG